MKGKQRAPHFCVKRIGRVSNGKYRITFDSRYASSPQIQKLPLDVQIRTSKVEEVEVEAERLKAYLPLAH